jgi:MFS family permease
MGSDNPAEPGRDGAPSLEPVAREILDQIGEQRPPRQRGRYQGLFTGVFALCSVAGPVLGGVLPIRYRGAGSSVST